MTRLLCVLALAAVVATAAPAGAQIGSSDQVRYKAPDGTLVTISENERRNRIADINDMLIELSNGLKMIFDAGGKLVVIDTRRLDKIALWLVANGGLTPGQIPAWKMEQVNGSLRAGDGLRAELAALRTATTITPAASPAPPAPPSPPASPPTASVPTGAVEWPDPMSWSKVRGETRGTFFVECEGAKRTGPYRLEFPGDGTVKGVFDDYPNYRYMVEGTILPFGTANGKALAGVPREPSLEWTASFQRAGSAIVMTTSTLELRPPTGGLLVNCNPGTMSQVRQ